MCGGADLRRFNTVERVLPVGRIIEAIAGWAATAACENMPARLAVESTRMVVVFGVHITAFAGTHLSEFSTLAERFIWSWDRRRITGLGWISKKGGTKVKGRISGIGACGLVGGSGSDLPYD